MITKTQLLEAINLEIDESDIKRCDELLQALRREYIESIFNESIPRVWNNASEYHTILSILMHTRGGYNEKIDFATNIGIQNFIDIDKLLTPHKIQSFSDWIIGDELILNSFINLSYMSASGCGPTEIALVLMSPTVTHSGRAQLPGDTTINGLYIEHKARATKRSKGGRLHDESKAMYDWKPSRELFKQLGYSDPYIRLTRYIKEIRDTLTLEQKELVARTVIDGNFKFVTDTNNLYTALVSGSIDEIKTEWGVLSFYNYKNCALFDTMIFFDIYHQKTLCVNDIQLVKDKLSYGCGVLFGLNREAMPQITIKV